MVNSVCADFQGTECKVRVPLDKISSIEFYKGISSDVITITEDHETKVVLTMDNGSAIILYHSEEEFDQIVAAAIVEEEQASAKIPVEKVEDLYPE